jgi:hypothetical protein
VPKDPARALLTREAGARHAAAACGRGDLDRCAWLRDFGQLGREETFALLRELCARGRAEDCVTLAQPAISATDPAQHTRALAWVLPLCEEGFPSACWHAALLFLRAPRDAGRALAALRRECDLGDPDGCHYLGELYWEGARDIPKNLPEAVRLYQRACELGTGSGCADAGAAYRDGVGVGRDVAQARALFERGCRLKWAKACEAVKRLP